MSLTLTATALPALAAVRLEVAGADPGPLPITRTDHNGTRTVRQLAGQQTSAGTLIVTDYEPALFGPLTYTVTDPLGAPVTASAELAVRRPVVSAAVSPFYRAELRAFTAASEAVQDDGTEHRILDAPAAVVVFGAYSSRAGHLEAWCASYEDAAAARRALTTGELVLIRHPEHRGMDAYVQVRRVDVANRPELVYDAATDTSTVRWALSLDYVEQEAPTGPLLSAAGWNYAALAELGLTYDELPAVFPTYNDLAVGP